MATRDELVARRDAIQIELETALQRIAAGDRSKQYDLTIKEKALARLDREIDALLRLEAEPMIRQFRASSSRGY